jgi:hypothetical protein
MNTTALITLISRLDILAPIIFIIVNPHWLSYLLRRWVRLSDESDVAHLRLFY